METVAVTGASGFIGQNLIEELTKRNFKVYKFGRTYEYIKCDRVYHLACPSSTSKINDDPKLIMDVILDKTREALKICPEALFINASSVGARDLISGPQGAYNIAKRCMETYLEYSGVRYINYQIPSVYGPGMNDDSFIKRCVDKTAYYPREPNKEFYIAHITEVVSALVDLRPIKIESITLGDTYNKFISGSRNLWI